MIPELKTPFVEAGWLRSWTRDERAVFEAPIRGIRPADGILTESPPTKAESFFQIQDRLYAAREGVYLRIPVLPPERVSQNPPEPPPRYQPEVPLGAEAEEALQALLHPGALAYGKTAFDWFYLLPGGTAARATGHTIAENRQAHDIPLEKAVALPLHTERKDLEGELHLARGEAGMALAVIAPNGSRRLIPLKEQSRLPAYERVIESIQDPVPGTDALGRPDEIPALKRKAKKRRLRFGPDGVWAVPKDDPYGSRGERILARPFPNLPRDLPIVLPLEVLEAALALVGPGYTLKIANRERNYLLLFTSRDGLRRFASVTVERR